MSKEQVPAHWEITCNICSKVIADDCKGHGLVLLAVDGAKHKRWFEAKAYDDLSKYDAHLCNQCSVSGVSIEPAPGAANV